MGVCELTIKSVNIHFESIGKGINLVNYSVIYLTYMYLIFDNFF